MREGVVVLGKGSWIVDGMQRYGMQRYPGVKLGTLGHYLIGFHGGRRNSPN